jgi:hypothetical protein
MAFLGSFGEAVNKGAESLGGSVGLTKNASRNAFLGGLLFGPGNALAGAAAGPMANYFTGSDAKNAANDAQKEANKTRKASVKRQMGARDQADSFAIAALRQNNSQAANSTGFGEQAPGGFVGSNLPTTAGTF